MAFSWDKILKTIVEEQQKNLNRPTRIFKVRFSRRDYFSPPPPVIEEFGGRDRFNWLYIHKAYRYEHDGHAYRSLYHAIIGGLLDPSRAAGYELVEYSTYTELRKWRAKGLPIMRADYVQQSVALMVKLLLQRADKDKPWVRKLLLTTGRAPFRPVGKWAEDRWLQTHYGIGLNVYGEALTAVRNSLMDNNPDLEFEYVRRLNNLLKNGRKVPYLEYYNGTLKPESFSRNPNLPQYTQRSTQHRFERADYGIPRKAGA